MRILISPAKKMKADNEFLPHTALPRFLSEAEAIQRSLRAMTNAELQKLWKCNDAIAKVNTERLRSTDLKCNLSPAIFAYEGIQYQHIAPAILENFHLRFVQEHLRILSGLYGLLRPFDGVVPYRLEMQARLSVNGKKNLYDFWGDKLANQLACETDFILNLASREYSKAVLPYLPESVRVLTCTFGERKEDTVIEKGTLCKIARGGMVRFLAQRNITDAEDLKCFCDFGYQYDEHFSRPDHYVFTMSSK